jgi:flavodoxin
MMTKKLVAYCSFSGVTAARAEKLASLIGADLHEIAPAVPYSAEDINWRNPESRCSKEHADPSIRPALQEEKTDLAAYDTVYIGFPIWWGVAPNLINTFIENNNLTDKKIVLFATSGGSPISAADAALKKQYPALRIVKA